MSLQFSNTTTKNGIIQLIERTLGFNDGDVSGDSTLLAQFTGDINLALDRAFSIIFESDGTWQFDDSNHTDYPIITTNLVSGQRDYSFTTDENGNQILEIFKVLVADPADTFHEILPVDVSSGGPASYTDGLNVGGQPDTYDKLANGIFLDPIPNYSVTNGLKVYVNREASYFLTSDTTKKSGLAGPHQEYLAIRPAFQYAYRKGLANMRDLEAQVIKMEGEIASYYSKRARDERKQLVGIRRSSR